MATTGQAPKERHELAAGKQDETYFNADRFTALKAKLEIGGQVYDLPLDPDVDMVAAILRAETAINEQKDENFVAAIIEGKKLLMQLLEEAGNEVPERIPVGVAQILSIFRFITGGRSAGDAILELIQAPADPDAKPDEEPAEPVPLSKRSTKRSSGSAKKTAGRRTGGATAPGESAASTSASAASG